MPNGQHHPPYPCLFCSRSSAWWSHFLEELSRIKNNRFFTDGSNFANQACFLFFQLCVYSKKNLLGDQLVPSAGLQLGQVIKIFHLCPPCISQWPLQQPINNASSGDLQRTSVSPHSVSTTITMHWPLVKANTLHLEPLAASVFNLANIGCLSMECSCPFIKPLF